MKENRSVGLVLGGARSGKSRFAQKLARGLSERPVYVATSRRWDDDHAARIARHQRERGAEWRTLEVEKALSAIADGDVRVVDCVTLWLTNYFVDLKQDAERALDAARREFDAAVAPGTASWFFVSNELGQGLHAETESGRKFTDLQGFVNQHIAARADWVVWMVAGIPVTVKGAPPLI